MTKIRDIILDTNHIDMDEREFSDILAILGWSQDHAAKVIGVSIRTANAWANGAPIPAAAAKVLRVANHRRFSWIPE